MSFASMNIHPKCLRLLEQQGIVTPTPIQAQAIPLSLEGKDILGVAQTGTGKTLAFGLPALTRLSQGKSGRNRMLVLTPTRELALQVNDSLQPFAKALHLFTTTIYGGVAMGPQIKALRQGCDILVATPGRLLDHMNRGSIDFKDLSVLVLDEGDRMLDMGFLPDIKRILSAMPKDRQTMLFSATFPPTIRQLAKDFQRDVQHIEVASDSSAADTVEQRIYTVAESGKGDLLTRFLGQSTVKCAIVFGRTKHRTDRIAKQLIRDGVKAEAIHGGRSQSQRQRTLAGFRRGKFQVLVATDVAARGLDVTGITHVVNFDIPGSFDDYVHRIGRTGRALATGEAITFVSPADAKELGLIERGLGSSLPRVDWEGAVNVSTHAQRPSRPAHFKKRSYAAKRSDNNNNSYKKPGKPGNFKKRRPPRQVALAR